MVTATSRPERVRILGAPVDLVNLDSAVARVVDLVDEGGSSVVVTLNPEMVMRGQVEPDFAAILNDAGLLIPDGIGIVMALRRRGYAKAQRVAGVELVDAYFQVASTLRHRVALVGGVAGVAETAAARYRQSYPDLQIVAADSGDPTAETAARLALSKPDVICAAYGAGLQERFLSAHLESAGAAVGIGIGGTLDFVAGRIRRAPQWVRDMGLEWAWRLGREPRRLRRQLALPRFWWQERQEAARMRRRGPS